MAFLTAKMDLATLDITKNAFVWYWYLNFDIIAIWAICCCYQLLGIVGITWYSPKISQFGISTRVVITNLAPSESPDSTRRILPVAAPHSKVCDAPRRRVAWVNDKTPRRWIERQGIFVENRLEFRKFVVELNVSENPMNGHSWHSLCSYQVLTNGLERDSFLTIVFLAYSQSTNMM